MAPATERRRFPRARISDQAVLLWQGQHRECSLRDISGMGAQLELSNRPAAGTEVVLYSDGFGRFRGRVVRHTPFGVSLRFHATNGRIDRTLRRLQIRLSESRAPAGPQPLSGEQRILLECLCASGRIAVSRSPSNRRFWQAIEECRLLGLVEVGRLSGDLYGLELSLPGLRAFELGTLDSEPKA
jgi:hypothetical protein